MLKTEVIPAITAVRRLSEPAEPHLNRFALVAEHLLELVRVPDIIPIHNPFLVAVLVAIRLGETQGANPGFHD
jgi:hypothetical protein